MEFEKLYEDSLELWPDKIDISEAIILDDQSIRYPNLSSIWDKVEDESTALGEWHDLMSWINFCGFAKAADKAHKEGRNVVEKDKLDRVYIKNRLIQNLREEGYEDMLESFLKDNP